MSRLNHYFLKEVLIYTAVTSMILLAIVWLTQSLRFLDLIVNKGLSFITFLQLTGLLVPMLLQVILPLAFLIGMLLTLKRRHDDNEFNALFASGFNRQQLIQPLLAAGALLTGIGYIISLWALPTSMTAFKELQHQIRHQEAQLLVQPGTFNQLGNGVMVYMREREGFNRLQQLLVHDSRNPQAPVTWMARSGQVQRNIEGQPVLILEQGIRQDVAPNRVSMLEFERHTLDITQRYGPMPERTPEANERTLTQLKALNENLGEAIMHEFRAEYHKRLLWPLLPLLFAAILGVLLVRPQRPRGSNVRPILLAGGIAFSLQALFMALHSLASQGQLLILYGQWIIPCTVLLFGWLSWQEHKGAA